MRFVVKSLRTMDALVLALPKSVDPVNVERGVQPPVPAICSRLDG